MLNSIKNFFISKNNLRIVAILATRNEINQLKISLNQLIRNNIQLAIIDNDSSDGTEEFCQSLPKKSLIYYEKLPFKGYFDLPEMLEKKVELRKKIDTDWVIHHDADEIMFSNRDGENLYDAVKRVQKLGYDSINLEEFVFIPENNKADYLGKDFYQEMRCYYHFAPAEKRLVRIYRNDLPVDNTQTGGHRMPLDKINLYPNNFQLRHYICLSQEHAKKKYLTRKFAEKALEKGWHRNRVIITEQKLNLDSAYSQLSCLENYKHRPKGNVKKTKHFWEW